MNFLSILVVLCLATYGIAVNNTAEEISETNQKYVDEDDEDRLHRRSYKIMDAPETDECITPQPITRDIRRRYNFRHQKFGSLLQVYGIPIIAFGEHDLTHLQKACLTVKFMLADHSKIRNSFYSSKVRFILLGEGENREDIPGIQISRDYSRGNVYLGKNKFEGVVFTPDYFECSPTSTKSFLHVVAHAMLKYAIPEVYSHFKPELRGAFNHALETKSLRGKYAHFSFKEYYAEGVLAYFDQTEVGKVGPKNTDMSKNARNYLELNDPALYNLIFQVHPCKNVEPINSCSTRIRHRHTLTTDCIVTDVEKSPKPEEGDDDDSCWDDLPDCDFYKEMGQCDRIVEGQEYQFRDSCRKSCGLC